VTESFDYAILCTGCDYTTPIKGQATSLEGRVREFEDWRERVAATKLPVLIAGGGHVGVEVREDDYHTTSETTVEGCLASNPSFRHFVHRSSLQTLQQSSHTRT